MDRLQAGLQWLTPMAQADQAIQWAFFNVIFAFLDDEVLAFQDNLLGGTLQWVSGAALAVLTLWILFQGFQVLTGRSRESLMGLVVGSLRAVLIVSAATTLAFGSSDFYDTFTNGMQREVSQAVTGDDDLPAEAIDRSLDLMQLTMVGIDALAVDSSMLKDDKDRALWLTGIGMAGPAVVGGALLLLYKLALALFVGLGPLFILSLLFEATRQLFARWLYYGIATMFTMSVLSFMVAVAMKMVLAVASIFAAQYGLAMAAGVPPQGISSMALQQGGLGLILTILLVSTPPMAGAFFQGTLGQFSAYNQFGGAGGAPPGAAGPGSGPTVSSAQLASPPTAQSVSHSGAMTRPQGADAGPFVDEIRPASRPTPVG